MAVTLTDPGAIAAASPVAATPGAGNTGTLAVADLSVVGPTRNANLTQTVTLNFTSPTSYTYTAGGVTSGAQAYAAGTPIQVNGWSLTPSGTPAAGDTLTVAGNVGGTGDNRNAIKLAQLAAQNLVGGGTLAGGYAAMVANVGGLAQAANTAQTAQTQGLQSALTSESSVAGVNLDEEATKLIQFQQQYQAAAKIITTANTVFDAILNIGG
jgi:flagellar hook-associated protein 1